MHTDTLDDIINQQQAYNERLYLVASENSPSISARLALLTDVMNRYYFPLEKSRHWAFPGNEFSESIYERCTLLLQEVTGAKFVNIRPVSGVSAMTIALAALARIGDTVASISPENGGHAITSAVAKRLGLRVVSLPYDQAVFSVDTSRLSEFIEREGVSLIYLDQPHVLFPQRVNEIKASLPESVKIYYDGSHTMGLTFGGSFQDPLKEGAGFLGGSTHKTIPGPHKGFIATNDETWHKAIDEYSRVFVSHDHGGDVAALTIVLEEMRGHWGEYAAQVIKNAQHLARRLDEKGLTVLAKNLGFTQSHQVWIDTHPFCDAFDAVMTLARHNIITNTINAPTLPGRLAVRIGVQEITYCGADERSMDLIADLFGDILIRKTMNERDLRGQVADLKKTLTPPFDREAFEKIVATITATVSV